MLSSLISVYYWGCCVEKHDETWIQRFPVLLILQRTELHLWCFWLYWIVESTPWKPYLWFTVTPLSLSPIWSISFISSLTQWFHTVGCVSINFRGMYPSFPTDVTIELLLVLCLISHYPLVNKHSYWPFIVDLPIKKMCFSIAMLVYQRVYHIPVTLSFCTLVLMEKKLQCVLAKSSFSMLISSAIYGGFHQWGYPKIDGL